MSKLALSFTVEEELSPPYMLLVPAHALEILQTLTGAKQWDHLLTLAFPSSFSKVSSNSNCFKWAPIIAAQRLIFIYSFDPKYYLFLFAIAGQNREAVPCLILFLSASVKVKPNDLSPHKAFIWNRGKLSALLSPWQSSQQI